MTKAGQGPGNKAIITATHIEPVLQCVQTSKQQHSREIGPHKEGA